MTGIRRRLPKEIFDQVFGFVLQLAANKKLLSGKTVAVDSTTLEANAAMKSIVRKDTGEDYKQYLTKLAQEEGIENPSKRYLMAAAAHNLGLVMRKLLGIGKPRGLRAGACLADLLWLAIRWLRRLREPIRHTTSSTNAMSHGPIPYALVG